MSGPLFCKHNFSLFTRNCDRAPLKTNQPHHLKDTLTVGHVCRDTLVFNFPRLGGDQIHFLTWEANKIFAHSPVAGSHKGLNDDGQLVFDDVEVA